MEACSSRHQHAQVSIRDDTQVFIHRYEDSRHTLRIACTLAVTTITRHDTLHRSGLVAFIVGNALEVLCRVLQGRPRQGLPHAAQAPLPLAPLLSLHLLCDLLTYTCGKVCCTLHSSLQFCTLSRCSEECLMTQIGLCKHFNIVEICPK